MRFISAGSYFSMAISTHGQLVWWGGDPLGAQQMAQRLADDLVDNAAKRFERAAAKATSSLAADQSPLKVWIPRTGRVVQVSAGGRHGVLLLDTGDVLTYGENGHGQLGNGDRLPIASPRAVNALRAERVRCVAVAAGRMHTLAVDESGALLAWGFGKNGATGQRSLEDALTPVKIELRGSTAGSANPGRVQTVACSDHCLAVTADGAVYAWGLGASGQLGFGDLLSHSKPRRVEALREVRAVGVSTGHSHSLVLSEAGAVFAFGRGTSGQLGRKVLESSALPVPVEMPPNQAAIAQVAAGGDHSLLLGVNGVVFTFGSGDFGVLGQGGTLPSPTPKKISAGLGIERVTAISAGFLHSIVVTVVRQTFTFGSNSSLQLGETLHAYSSVPRLVYGLLVG